MIELNNVTLAYSKEYNALQNVSLKVGVGETLIIYGEENSGKSSLLRVLVGIEKPNQGQAYLKGVVASKADFKNVIALGYLPVHPVFKENRTVYKNLEYLLHLRKVAKNQRDIKLSNVLKSYNLEHIKDFKIKELSYFDRIKVCLARFSLRPLEIIVIDDIFKNLDEGEIKKTITYIHDLIITNNSATVIATSNEGILKKLGGNIVTIENGSIIDK